MPEKKQTTCCIVGAGPAGVVLAWLLARQGIAVTLLERHDDFDRDFRGDTLHPGVLEILEEMGLAELVLAIPHTRMSTLSFHAGHDSLTIADLSRLKTKFPFVAMLPQCRFLETLVVDARRFVSFELVMGADVRELIEVEGEVRGVRYADHRHELHAVLADLTVAVDGRSSRLRKAAGLMADSAAPEIDVLWFRVPRLESQTGGGYFAAGAYMIVLDREMNGKSGTSFPRGNIPICGQPALRHFASRLPNSRQGSRRVPHTSSIGAKSVFFPCKPTACASGTALDSCFWETRLMSCRP